MSNDTQRTRICPKCHEEKNIDCFYQKGKCKECYQRYYQENKGRYKSYYQTKKNSLKVRTNKERERNRSKIRALKERPCADCGIQYPHYVMDFDHIERLGEKKASIAYLAGHSSWSMIEKELAKCELVCSNCHRERTWKRLSK